MSLGQKIIIISVIFSLVALVLVFLAIYPLFKGIKKSSQDLVEARKGEISLENKTKNLEQFKEIYKTLEPDLEEVDKLFANKKVPIDFIKFLEKTAIDSQILIDISPISPKTKESEPWPSLGFKITLTGSFPNCLKFLEKIESASYLIEVQNLTIRRSVEKKLKTKEPETFLEGGATGTLSIKVFAK